jgi:RNA polymerase sigma factor (sigma-70 family)
MTSTEPLIHVVDDDRSFRTSVARLLQTSGYRVAVYESGEQLLENPPNAEPGCILLDLRMSGLSGLDLQDRLAKAECILPIVFLTGQGDIPTTVQAIKAGAEDFLSKPVPKRELLDAVKRAVERYEEAHTRHARLDALQARIATFTPRENEVFVLVVRGKLNKQIAFDLGISERTVKVRRHNLMQKLQVRSLAEAVSIAERLGMLTAQADREIT